MQLIDKGNLTVSLKDSKGMLWIGTGRPYFYKYNTITKKVTTYFLGEIGKPKKPNRNEDAIVRVECIFEDNHNTIWIGTSNAGLLKYSRETDSFTSIVNDPSNNQGLHYNYDITGIFQDSDENIWLSTDDGLVQKQG